MEVNPQLWEQVKTKLKYKMEQKVMPNNFPTTTTPFGL